MRKVFRKKIIIATASFLIIAALAIIFVYKNWNKIEVARAGSGDNVFGWAWSGNYGWVSFNSTNCDIDGDGTYEGASEDGGPAPADCPTSGTVNDYGVNIDSTTGDFSGYAWSSNLGWISFNRSDTGNPPSDDPGSGSGPIAKYNSGDNKVYGWAKILALGDDGWIRFDHGQTNEASIDASSGEFHGYAWNGNDIGIGLGWLSFNCAEGGDSGQNICGSFDYKVIGDIGHKPRAQNLESPDIGNTEICSYGAKRAYLKWEYYDEDGDPQKAYQIIFDDDNNPADPLLDTGQCISAGGNCLISGSANRFPIYNLGLLNYGQHYYWWVRVWDSNDKPSDWAASASDGVGGGDVSFIIPQHEYPDASTTEGFIWFPRNPSAQEEIKFISTTSAKYYTNVTSNVPYDCNEANCDWHWEFSGGSGGSFNSSQNASTTRAVFSDEGNMEMSLIITDSDGYSCTSTKEVKVKKKLPIWIENK